MFVTVTKIGTGLSDEEWGGIKERTRGLEVDHKPARVSSLIKPSVCIEPALVIGGLSDEITRSRSHADGAVGDQTGPAQRPRWPVSLRETDRKPTAAT